MSYKTLLRKGKRTLARGRVKIRRHRQLAESKQIQKLTLQRNKAEKEAARLAAINEAREQAMEAKVQKERELSQSRAVRKQKLATVEKQAKSALSGLTKAIKAIDAYANRDVKKKSTQTKIAKTRHKTTAKKKTTRKTTRRTTKR